MDKLGRPYVQCVSKGNFKIKSLKDAEIFVMECLKASYYVNAVMFDDYPLVDVLIEPKDNRLYTRPVTMRGNVFNPYSEKTDMDAVHFCYKARKFINEELFNN